MASGSTGLVSTNRTPELTLANVRDGHIKYKNLKKDQLKELCATFFDHIEDLKLRLEKSKAPPAPVSNEDYELRAELKEWKDAVFVDKNGINTMGDKPTGGLTQAYWATGVRRAIPWDVINKLAEDDSGKTSSEEDDIKGAINATSVEEDDVEGAAKANATSSKAKSAKLASWSRWPSPRTYGACRRLSRCRRRPRPRRGRSAR
jgi:hypothetical protein